MLKYEKEFNELNNIIDTNLSCIKKLCENCDNKNIGIIYKINSHFELLRSMDANIITLLYFHDLSNHDDFAKLTEYNVSKNKIKRILAYGKVPFRYYENDIFKKRLIEMLSNNGMPTIINERFVEF